MLEWILERLPVIIFVLVFVAQIVRGFFKMKGSRQEAPPTARPDVLEEHRRTQEVQEDIRRRIAERRAGRSPAPEPSHTDSPQPPVVTEPDPTAIPPLPEPLRRMLEQLEKKVQPPPPVPAAPPPLSVERRHAEIERQQRLADELKAVESARLVIARRATHVAEAKAEASRTEDALRTAARRRLDEDLRDPESLRRAFVLREVLGPPVSLR